MKTILEASINDHIYQIRKQYENLLRAEKAYHNFEKKKQDFFELFSEEKTSRYVVGGVLCLLVLIFDFWVSHRSMELLADVIRVPVAFLALLFSILDGFLAIYASGGLAGLNQRRKELHKKSGVPILILLGLVKIVLFVILVINKYTEIDPNSGLEVFQLSTFDAIKIIGSQVLFVIIVYSILSTNGFGLWYLFGVIWFGFYKALLENPEKITFELRKLFNNLLELTKDGFEEILTKEQLTEIYKKVSKTNEVINEQS
ncbi:MAG: hypothetical protein N2560_10390 [Ignavibacteria bacterium]|nr:hypothetical protein [Ignavibacteria bacterium]